ncbi:hypothetical protein B0H14DRAFT_3421558 [Mycena olivaceomarginata]|nr:hypothetical protein B0H14DRAFT_3421558 [Mycena olivaceomarginata]
MPGPNQPAPKRPTLPTPFPYAPSPLPASDAFPLSTATTNQPPDDDDFVPPIVTLNTSVVSSPSVSKTRTQKLTIKLPPSKPPSSDRFDGFDELDDRGGGMAPPPRPTGAFPVDPGPSSSSAGPAADGAPPAKPPKKSRKKKEKGAEEGEAEREKPAKKPRTKKVKAGAGAEAGEEGGSGQEKPMPKKKQGTSHLGHFFAVLDIFMQNVGAGSLDNVTSYFGSKPSRRNDTSGSWCQLSNLAEWQFSNPTSSVGRKKYRGGLYGRLNNKAYFPTTVTNMHPTANQCKVLHPECLGMVMVRELARSQGFPDWFGFVSLNDNVVTVPSSDDRKNLTNFTLTQASSPNRQHGALASVSSAQPGA